MAPDDSIPGWSTEDQTFLRTATELLDAGQYEHLAKLLHQVQLAYDENGDAIPAHVLVLARRICLACSQSQAEADWHQQACEEAAQREDKLRHQLTTLLDLVSERDLPAIPGQWNLIPDATPAVLGPPGPGLPEPGEPLSLWQRIQGVLRWRLDPQPLERVTSEVTVQGPPPPIPARAEVPGQSPTEESETSSQPSAKDAPGLPLPPVQEAEVGASPLPMPEHESDAVPTAKVEKRQEPGPPSLVVYCLGPFRVYQDDHLITDWESQKAKCVLKHLLAQHGSPVVKDVLMDLLWPDAEPEAARRNLHQAVYSLRKTLRQRHPDFPYVWFESDCYLLSPDTTVWLDFEQFEKHVRDGQRLEASGQHAEAIAEYGIAEGLYQGNYFEDDLYEDWPRPRRQHLQTLYVQMADRLSEYYVQHGDLAAAIVVCRKVLSVDRCCEEAYRWLMQCYRAQGQRHLAVRQYQACVHALKEELDLTPSEETVELYQHIATAA